MGTTASALRQYLNKGPQVSLDGWLTACVAKHRRPGPANQPSPAVPRVRAADPLAAYNKRRRPPMDIYRRHRPVHGGAGHLRPDQPRVLEEWDDFAYQVLCTAPRRASPRPRSGRTD